MPEDDQFDVVKYLSDNDSLLEVMLQIESYLDDLDIFAYANWIEGQIADGPWVKRYWVCFTLKYQYKKMPDPQGGLRLLKYGAKVQFEKTTEEVAVEAKTPEDIDPETKKPKMKKQKIWYVHMQVPRRFLEEKEINDLDLYSNLNKDDDEEPNDTEDAPVDNTEMPAPEQPTQESGDELEL